MRRGQARQTEAGRRLIEAARQERERLREADRAAFAAHLDPQPVESALPPLAFHADAPLLAEVTEAKADVGAQIEAQFPFLMIVKRDQ